MRNKIIAGNWKMNKDLEESAKLIEELIAALRPVQPQVTVVVCPPYISLPIVSKMLKGSSIRLGAQNMSEHDDGAYTGEVSWKMLRSAGCEFVILGHSERRQYFGETNELINLKTRKALGVELRPIVCVGETLEERERGATSEVVKTQVKGVLSGLSESDMRNVVVAYEPVWAIGTGRTATPVQAQEVHLLIRKTVGQLFSWTVAEGLIIQYGGSVKPDNAADLLVQPDIDGALVGGACLKAESFAGIVKAAS
jgi:triosephosphate isomerase